MAHKFLMTIKNVAPAFIADLKSKEYLALEKLKREKKLQKQMRKIQRKNKKNKHQQDAPVQSTSDLHSLIPPSD